MSAALKLMPSIEGSLFSIYAKLLRYADGKAAGALGSSYIAGGAIVSLVLGDTPKDYDIWFRTLDDWTAAVEGLSLQPTRKSKYSYTYVLPSGEEVQLVKSRIGEPADVVGTFDFKHTHCYYEPGKDVVCDRAYLLSKRLDFVKGNLCHPVNTLQRVLKFARRGYTMPNQSIADLMNAVGAHYEQKQAERSFSEEAGEVFSPEWGGGSGGSR